MLHPCGFKGCRTKASYKLVAWDRMTKSWQAQLWACYTHCQEAKLGIPGEQWWRELQERMPHLKQMSRWP